MKWEALTDEVLLACLVMGEQRGIEGFLRYVEWMYIVETVKERVTDRRWPDTIRGVILQPQQFSCFNDNQDPNTQEIWRHYSEDTSLFREALEFVQRQLNGQHGELASSMRPNHYLVEPLYYSSRSPAWVDKMQIIFSGGPKGHIFLTD